MTLVMTAEQLVRRLLCGGHYSWWSQRFGVREKDIGWSQDMVFASPGAMRFVNGAFIEHRVKGSDHAPVGVTMEPGVLGRRGVL